jgi:hypothetical protein
MKYNLIIECPNGTNIDILSTSANPIEQEIYQTIKVQLEGIWPSNPMPGSTPLSDRVLIHAAVTSDSDHPLSDLHTMIAAYGLDWQILAMQTFKAAESYVVGQDEEGNDEFVPRATKLMAPNTARISAFVAGSTPFSSVYAGQAPWES